MDRPEPNKVILLREKVQERFDFKITQAQEYCASQLHADKRSWQKWEKGDRKMHPAFWELINIKTK